MSLTIVAIAGLFLGFLCLAIGFYMESAEAGGMGGTDSFKRMDFEVMPKPAKRAKRMKVRIFKNRRKAA